MSSIHYQLAQRVAERFIQVPQVEAIAIAGSLATAQAEASSDIDLYCYTTRAIPSQERLAIGRAFSPEAQLIDFWGDGMEWIDPATGIHVDAVFFDVAWMTDQTARVLERHEAWMGYSTCFWHTVRVSQILFDRNGWLTTLNATAQAPYPHTLAKAIVALNFPVLRDVYPSYRTQIVKAHARQDIVSLNHRVAGLLASYFDVLFAINMVPHPGEKRLLKQAMTLCAKRPPHLEEHVHALITTPNATTVDALLDELEALLRAEGWL